MAVKLYLVVLVLSVLQVTQGTPLPFLGIPNLHIQDAVKSVANGVGQLVSGASESIANLKDAVTSTVGRLLPEIQNKVTETVMKTIKDNVKIPGLDVDKLQPLLSTLLSGKPISEDDLKNAAQASLGDDIQNKLTASLIKAVKDNVGNIPGVDMDKLQPAIDSIMEGKGDAAPEDTVDINQLPDDIKKQLSDTLINGIKNQINIPGLDLGTLQPVFDSFMGKTPATTVQKVKDCRLDIPQLNLNGLMPDGKEVELPADIQEKIMGARKTVLSAIQNIVERATNLSRAINTKIDEVQAGVEARLNSEVAKLEGPVQDVAASGVSCLGDQMQVARGIAGNAVKGAGYCVCAQVDSLDERLTTIFAEIQKIIDNFQAITAGIKQCAQAADKAACISNENKSLLISTGASGAQIIGNAAGISAWFGTLQASLTTCGTQVLAKAGLSLAGSGAQLLSCVAKKTFG